MRAQPMHAAHACMLGATAAPSLLSPNVPATSPLSTTCWRSALMAASASSLERVILSSFQDEGRREPDHLTCRAEQEGGGDACARNASVPAGQRF